MNKLEERMITCLLNNYYEVKSNIFDMIFGRKRIDKLVTHCHYRCSLELGIKNLKINGRYPFRPILNCTEFLSSLFSFFNFLSHALCYRLYIWDVISDLVLGKMYSTQFLINQLCWISSTLFHINDSIITRHMDYFMAFIVLAYTAYLNALRIFLLHHPRNGRFALFCTCLRIIGIPLCVLYSGYMTFINFNYFLSKLICGGLFTFIISSWMYLYCCLSRHGYSKHILFYSLLLLIGGTIEIIDVPPIGYMLDSHAIWHLITALITPLYYRFLREDLSYEKTVRNKASKISNARD
jgi:hypothetical protein